MDTQNEEIIGDTQSGITVANKNTNLGQVALIDEARSFVFRSCMGWIIRTETTITTEKVARRSSEHEN